MKLNLFCINIISLFYDEKWSCTSSVVLFQHCCNAVECCANIRLHNIQVNSLMNDFLSGVPHRVCIIVAAL